MNDLSGISFSLALDHALLLLWLVLLIVHIILSLVFVYHWRAYATNAAVIRRTFISYFTATSLCLFGAMAALLFI